MYENLTYSYIRTRFNEWDVRDFHVYREKLFVECARGDNKVEFLEGNDLFEEMILYGRRAFHSSIRVSAVSIVREKS